MYYDTVEIKPVNGKWVFKHYKMNLDRQSSKGYTPNSDLGFFHYPRKWGDQKGFRLLKEAIIKRHEDEIAKLTKSLSELRLVKLPNDKARFREERGA
jgi:hypothetical protein